MLYFTESHHSLLLDVKQKTKTTKHSKNNSKSNTIKKQMGKTLQVLFICFQQADMQINCLNSCISTKQEEMCRWQLAELSIPSPSPFLLGPRYSQQCQEKRCNQRNKGQEIKISPGICAAAGLLLFNLSRAAAAITSGKQGSD